MQKKCQICKIAPATIHLTDIKNNVKTEMHLCEDCAKKNGININKSVSLEKIFSNSPEEIIDSLNISLSSIGNNEIGEKKKKVDKVCSHCGMKWKEFRKEGRLGCPHDYVVFKNGLIPLLEDVHCATEHHVGKVPNADIKAKRYNEIIELKRKLRDAVIREDYEIAAGFRDEIEELEKLL